MPPYDWGASFGRRLRGDGCRPVSRGRPAGDRRRPTKRRPPRASSRRWHRRSWRTRRLRFRRRRHRRRHGRPWGGFPAQCRRRLRG